MFKAKDKNGTEVFLRDKVKYEGVLDAMGLLGEVEGLVILIPEENTVQVQSLEGGTPEMKSADEVEVTYSLVQKVAALSNNAELQELIMQAELRYDKAVADGKKKGTRSPRAKKPTVIDENPWLKKDKSAPASDDPFANIGNTEEML